MNIPTSAQMTPIHEVWSSPYDSSLDLDDSSPEDSSPDESSPDDSSLDNSSLDNGNPNLSFDA